MVPLILIDFLGASSASTHLIDDQLAKYWWWLFIAAFAMFLFFLFHTISTSILMHYATGKARFRMCASNVITGQFYARVTPLGAGAQAFQIRHLYKEEMGDEMAITLPAMKYLVGRFSFLTVSILAVVLSLAEVFPPTPYVYLHVGIYVAAIVGIILNLVLPTLLIVFICSKKTCSRLVMGLAKAAKFLRLIKNADKFHAKLMKKLDASIVCIKTMARKRRLLLCFLFTMMAKIMFAMTSYFVLRAFGFESSHGWGFAEITMLSLIISCSLTFIPLPGNIGVAELSFYWVFSTALMYSTDIASGAIATLAWRLVTFYLIIFVGFVHLIFSRKKKAQAS